MYGIMPQLIRNLIKDEENLVNAGLITVTAILTQIHLSQVFNVVTGDRLYFAVDIDMLKGGVVGPSFLELSKNAGTAVVHTKGQDLATRILEENALFHSGGTRWYGIMMEILTVISSGTYQLLLRGRSVGSNSTIAIGDTRMQTILFR